MKVYLRDVNDHKGRYIGDVPPNQMRDVFEQVREMSVWSGNAHYTDFTHQIVYDEDEAYLEIHLDGS